MRATKPLAILALLAASALLAGCGLHFPSLHNSPQTPESGEDVAQGSSRLISFAEGASLNPEFSPVFATSLQNAAGWQVSDGVSDPGLLILDHVETSCRLVLVQATADGMGFEPGDDRANSIRTLEAIYPETDSGEVADVAVNVKSPFADQLEVAATETQTDSEWKMYFARGFGALNVFVLGSLACPAEVDAVTQYASAVAPYMSVQFVER